MATLADAVLRYSDKWRTSCAPRLGSSAPKRRAAISRGPSLPRRWL